MLNWPPISQLSDKSTQPKKASASKGSGSGDAGKAAEGKVERTPEEQVRLSLACSGPCVCVTPCSILALRGRRVRVRVQAVVDSLSKRGGAVYSWGRGE